MDDEISIGKSMLLGFLSGLAVAFGGAVKDSPYEGFSLAKFMRSPIIGMIEAPILNHAFKPNSGFLLFLATIATERLTVEIYKLFRAVSGRYMPMKFKYGEWGVPKKIIRVK